MSKQLSYIDLFAGCGGLSTGLYLAGWSGLFAIERNATAFSTLQANLIGKKKHFKWPDWLPMKNWAIEELLAEKREQLKMLNGTIDLVVGGPPCQGFSTAGRRREADKRNHLVHSYLEMVELIQPRAIFFENVRGFTMKFKANPEEGLTYSQLVINNLKKLGYSDARGEIVDMSDYGVPQRRRRFIVIATRDLLADKVFAELESHLPTYLALKGIPRKNSVRSALSDLRRCHGVTTCPDASKFDSGITSRASTGLQKHLRNQSQRYTPDSHRFVKHTRDVEGVFLRLLSKAPRNKCILGEDRAEFGLKKRSVTVLMGNAAAPTVTTIPDDFIHYSEPRVMTVRECARLQTFPDWFEFKGPYTTGGKQRILQVPRYTQVGNAIPPLFAELVGLALEKVLSNV